MARLGRISKKGVWIWPIASVLMLIGMISEARTHIKPADADEHLAQSKQAIDGIPTTIIGPTGNIWSGTDEVVPASATQLLRPNTILSRQYVKHGADGQSVALLIVHCSDARDLQGHYPHNCYPAQGQDEISQEQRAWHLKDMDIPGIEYHFAGEQLGAERIVYNFFVTPAVPGALVSHPELNGVICPDIDSVYKSGEDYQRRYYGAAEFQMVSSAPMTRDQRDQAFVDLLTPIEDVIRKLENRDPANAITRGGAQAPRSGGK
ncbi:MAG: EpsI family protein [Planctomycetota bacterium]|nr:EpsI family protein [Planctomycetota bacterium]